MPLDYAHQTPAKIGVYTHDNFPKGDTEKHFMWVGERPGASIQALLLRLTL
jgi:hypothetical protein